MGAVRWFEDGHSARAYIAARGPSLARAAYWPKLPIARQFDAAWYTSVFNRTLDPNLPWLDTAEDWNDWRRCMVEIFGDQRFLREGGARLVAEDPYGKLWESDAGMRSTHLLLEVTNETTEPDGTRRVYFLRVPPEVMTPREAVAWTYGLSAEQHELAVRT